jgi:hypothetical protein
MPAALRCSLDVNVDLGGAKVRFEPAAGASVPEDGADDHQRLLRGPPVGEIVVPGLELVAAKFAQGVLANGARP